MTIRQLSFDPVEQARQHWVDHGWGDCAEGMAAVTSLMRAQQIVLARVDAVLRTYDISFARYEVLMLLFFSSTGQLPMRVIGSRLQVHPTSVTNAVDRLEAAGLVQRRPHPSDRRAMLVAITEAGRDVARRATDELNDKVFAHPGISSKQIRSLVSVLTSLREQAGDFTN